MDITKENGIATNCNVVESENGTVESKLDSNYLKSFQLVL